jgi:hypothetical protein
MRNLRPVGRNTGFLLPPSVDEWLPEQHLARFEVQVIYAERSSHRHVFFHAVRTTVPTKEVSAMKRMMWTAVIAATALGAAGALAQPASNTANPTPEQQKRNPSGPAAGSPATLGTGGQTPATPHQSEVLRKNGAPAAQQPAVQQEEGSRKGATNPSK